MVRQNEARRRAPVLLMLDVRPGAHDRGSFERAVEACASVVTVLERLGRPCEVILSTGVVVGAAGRRHLANVMDELAVVEPHGPDRIVAASTRRRTGALVACMGACGTEEGAALSVILRSGEMMTVVTCASDAPGVPPRIRRFRPMGVRYGPDTSFVKAWNESILQWQRSIRLPSSASPARA
jgi:uncharacterized protein (DUF58 family)